MRAMREPALKPLSKEEDDALTERALEQARQGIGIPWEEVKAWIDSWDTDHELPPPKARKVF